MSAIEYSLAKEIAAGRYPTLRDLVQKAKTTIYPELVDMYPPLNSTVVDVRRVTRTLRAGKTFRYRVVVATGGKGLLGVGVAKAKTVPLAKEKALRSAKKNLIALAYRQDRGCMRYLPLRPAMAKKGATIVTVVPLQEGISVTSSKYGKMVCRIADITNLCIRVGNKGRERKGKAQCRLNYVTALHQALRRTCP